MSEFNINGFEILEKIGEGGMATVWKAKQISLDRLVAIKVLSPKLAANKEDIDMFRQEAQSAAKLKHSDIIQVYDARTDEGYYSLIMEFIDGDTVGDWQRRTKILDESNVMLVSESVALALGYAWETNKIIHCDIKPDNVMIDADGTVKLADLGLSRTISSLDAAQDLEEVMGTPAYMSPEQVQGEINIDCRNDIYSLGAMMYHLITGKMLFEGYSEEQIMEMQLYEVPPSVKSLNSNVSQGMSDLIAMMLEKNPDKRPKDWRQVINKLHSIKTGDTVIRKKLVTNHSLKRKVGELPPKKIIEKKKPSKIHIKTNPSSTIATDIQKKKSPVAFAVTITIVLVVGIVIFIAMSHANKIKKEKDAANRIRIAQQIQYDKEQKAYNAVMTYHSNNPSKFEYVISKLKDFKKTAETRKYQQESTKQISTLQTQYEDAVKDAIETMDRLAAKYIGQDDFMNAQFIYTGYKGDFPEETKSYRNKKSSELKELMDNMHAEEQKNTSVKKVVLTTLHNLSQTSTASATSFFNDQISQQPELAENYTIQQLSQLLALLDSKKVIMESYTKLKEAGEPITLQTKNSTITATIKSVEDDKLKIKILNSDGIPNSDADIPYTHLSQEELEGRIKENKDAYNLKKGLEHSKNKCYDIAEIYFQQLPKNYSKLMLSINNKNAKQFYDEMAEEDLTKILRAFDIEVYCLEDLETAAPPSLTSEQAESLKKAINAWNSEYAGHSLDFQITQMPE
jgi:serine/threonine protein kinase